MDGRQVYIISAARTPIGSLCGSLSTLKASDLGSIVIKESLSRAKLEAGDVDEVIMGQTLTAGQGQNPARQAAIKAGIPISVPAYQINMLCGSGLKAVVNGYTSIIAGESQVVVAGGQESMSQAQHSVHIRKGMELGNATMVDTLICDGLTDAFENVHMGITAENVAKKYNISREEQDKYAAKSQERVQAAEKKSIFQNEIIQVEVPTKKGPRVVSQDEYPRPTTVEGLAKLRPAFIKNEGTVTAGNASGINDGAAAVVLMSKEAAMAKGVFDRSHGRIVAVAQTGLEPGLMGMGPVSAVKLVLQKAKWTKEEVDLYELNEAFASQSIACLQELGLDAEKVNVHGGAIALGHPIGASGARILVTLLYALRQTMKKKGVASLCIGGGMGIAIAVETQP